MLNVIKGQPTLCQPVLIPSSFNSDSFVGYVGATPVSLHFIFPHTKGEDNSDFSPTLITDEQHAALSLFTLLSRSLTVSLLFVLCYLPLILLQWTSQLCSPSKYGWLPLVPKPRSGIIHPPAALPAPSDIAAAAESPDLLGHTRGHLFNSSVQTDLNKLRWWVMGGDNVSNHGSDISTGTISTEMTFLPVVMMFPQTVVLYLPTDDVSDPSSDPRW